MHRRDEGLVAAVLEHGDRPGERRRVAGEQGGDVGTLAGEVDVARPDQLVDHAGQPEALAVLRGEDLDAALGEQGDLVGDDDPAAAAEDLHVAGADLGQARLKVGEVLDVAALVGRQRDALHVLLDRGRDHGVDAAVVAEVDDLGALRLQDAPHDVDRRVVAVEQAGRRDEPDRVRGHVQRGLLDGRGRGHLDRGRGLGLGLHGVGLAHAALQGSRGTGDPGLQSTWTTY